MGTFADKDLTDFIEAVYESSTSTDADPWARVYQRIATLVSSGQGGLALHSAHDDRFNVVTTTVDPAYLKSYFEHYQYVSPFRRSITELKPGEHFSRRRFLSDRDYIKSEYYNEFYRGQEVFEIEHHALFSSEGITGGLSLTRSIDRPEFSREERQLIAHGVRHLSIGFKNYVDLVKFRSEHNLLSSVLEYDDRAVFLVDSKMRTTFTSRKADELLSSGVQISRSTDRVLRFSVKSVDEKLRAAAHSIDTVAGGRSPVVGTLFVGGTNGRPRLRVDVNYIGSVAPSWLAPQRQLMIIVSYVRTRRNDFESLCIQFGLTPAEQRVVRLLIEGQSPAHIVDLLQISSNTVKTHLKRIFRKTGRHRQSELIRLFLS
ncbi:MAG: hypothetical protein JNL64_10300 [Blastocatellia bacterium]|nr:hypothetical protein [Blastocatellia bacterium]